jgi:hypothetical protein
MSRIGWSILAMNSSKAPLSSLKPINFIYLSIEMFCGMQAHTTEAQAAPQSMPIGSTKCPFIPNPT